MDQIKIKKINMFTTTMFTVEHNGQLLKIVHSDNCENPLEREVEVFDEINGTQLNIDESLKEVISYTKSLLKTP